MTTAEKLLKDKEAIYIGNIFTVDADLNLPTEGKNGSVIAWNSDYPHLIDNTGRVHRPRAGTGNREVRLTATLTLDGQREIREFTATVLQVESTLVFTRIFQVEAQIPEGKAWHLPSVVILETHDGCFTTLPVTWKDAPDFSIAAPGLYEIKALPPDGRYPGLIPTAVVTVLSKDDPDTQDAGPKPVLKPFPLKDVQVDGGIFKENKTRIVEYLLGISDDSMLYNFRKAAGLDTLNAEPMTGWDAPQSLLKGHTTGHYLSAIALAVSCCTGEEKEKFLKKVNHMVEGLAQCQDAMALSGKFHPGFLSGYSEDQFDQLEEYAIYPRIWAPYYTLHKIIAGLLDCYELAGIEKAFDICRKLGIWVFHRLDALSEEKRQKMWSMYIAGEYGGMNEVMARLYGLDPRDEYMAAAKYFDNDKLFYPLTLDIDTLGGIHANQHIPQVLGAVEIFEKGGGKSYYDIAKNFWHMVHDNHCYCIGGTSEGEMFQRVDGIGAFLSDRTAESCVSYNMLKLTGRLFVYTPESHLMDYYEKTLINHIVASHDQSGPTGGSTYFMPLQPGAEKSFDLDENSCCHGTGLESHLKYQESIYYHQGDTLYVALYIPSTLHWSEKGIKILQTADLIAEQRAAFTVEGNGFLCLKLRRPSWLSEPAVVKVNGKETPYGTEDGYIVLERDFISGDTVELQMPFTLHSEPTPDKPEILSVYYGPLVLAAADSREEFIPWPSGKTAQEALTPADEPYSYHLGKVLLKPHYNLQGSPYHVYLKQA